MLMQEPTPERIETWQKVYAYFRPLLRPNRKSGPQIVDYSESPVLAEEVF